MHTYPDIQKLLYPTIHHGLQHHNRPAVGSNAPANKPDVEIQDMLDLGW